MPVGGGVARPDYSQHQSVAGAEGTGGTGGAGGGASERWRAPEGLAAAPAGGGVAWPGFEATRRAKLAARTARGRAAAHGRTKEPGPAGARNISGATATRQQAPHQRAQAYKKPTSAFRMSVCGGARGIRTPDLLIANETRYQLRHSPKDSDSLAPWGSATQADHDRVRDATDRKSAGIRVSAPSR